MKSLPENVKKIVSGDNHTIALTKDGKIYGSGCNRHVQLKRIKNQKEENEFINNVNYFCSSPKEMTFDRNLFNEFQCLDVDYSVIDVCVGWQFSILLLENGRLEILGNFPISNSDFETIKDTKFSKIFSGPKSFVCIFENQKSFLYFKKNCKPKQFDFNHEIVQISLTMFNFVVLLDNNNLYFSSESSKFGVDMGTFKRGESLISMNSIANVLKIEAGWSHFLLVGEKEGKYFIYGFGRSDFCQFGINCKKEIESLEYSADIK